MRIALGAGRARVLRLVLKESALLALIGGIALAYAVWLVYAGGTDYLFVAALFYLAGTTLFLWARAQAGRTLLAASEKLMVGLVSVVSVVAVLGLVQGWITV